MLLHPSWLPTANAMLRKELARAVHFGRTQGERVGRLRTHGGPSQHQILPLRSCPYLPSPTATPFFCSPLESPLAPISSNCFPLLQTSPTLFPKFLETLSLSLQHSVPVWCLCDVSTQLDHHQYYHRYLLILDMHETLFKMLYKHGLISSLRHPWDVDIITPVFVLN